MSEMGNKKENSWYVWILIIVFLLIASSIIMNSAVKHKAMQDDIKEGISGKLINEQYENQEEQPIIVSSVIDGDTIKLSTGERVRLIGINAPEKGEKCYEKAREYLENLILDKEIILEKDIDEKDQYGRGLGYVYLDDLFVNLELVKLGFAYKYEYGGNTKYSSEFEEAENEAKKSCGCIWQPCIDNKEKIDEEENLETPNYIEDGCFTITEFHFNAEGDDNYNLNDEYVTLKNICDYSIDMGGWTIKDETSREDHKYYFSDFRIEKGNSITLYTGKGTNTNSELYWGRSEGNYGAIWNNDGDTLFLRDTQGNLVLSKTYEGY